MSSIHPLPSQKPDPRYFSPTTHPGFISKIWQITPKGMYAGSCNRVICLVIVLESLRRLGREIDSNIRKTTSNTSQEAEIRRLSSDSSALTATARLQRMLVIA